MTVDILLPVIFVALAFVVYRLGQFAKQSHGLLMKVLTFLNELLKWPVYLFFPVCPVYIYVRIHGMPASWYTLGVVVDFLLGEAVFFIPIVIGFFITLGAIYFILGPNRTQHASTVWVVLFFLSLIALSISQVTKPGKLEYCQVRNMYEQIVFGKNGPDPADYVRYLSTLTCGTTMNQPFDLGNSSILSSNAYHHLAEALNGLGVGPQVSNLIAAIATGVGLLSDVLGVYSFALSRKKGGG